MLGQDAGIELGGRRIFLVHYRHYAEAMAATGDWDLVCCGHDHNANIHTVKNLAGKYTWLVNPGTVGGIKAPATRPLTQPIDGLGCCHRHGNDVLGGGNLLMSLHVATKNTSLV